MKKFFALFLAVAIIVVLIFAYVGWQILHSQNTYSVNLSHPSVIQQMRDLGRLETASYTMEKVIEAGNGTQSNPLSDFLYGDRILLIAHGQVTAGIDLKAITSQNLQVNGQKATLTLPGPAILSTSLDPTQTRVFDRKLGVFTKGDPNLETTALAAAQQSITQAACDSGILQQASTSAQQQLTSFFKLLGYTDVSITVGTGRCALLP